HGFSRSAWRVFLRLLEGGEGGGVGGADVEDLVDLRDLDQFLDLAGERGKLDVAAFAADGGERAGHFAEAGAVDVADAAQAQHYLVFAALEVFDHAVVKTAAAFAEDEAAGHFQHDDAILLARVELDAHPLVDFASIGAGSMLVPGCGSVNQLACSSQRAELSATLAARGESRWWRRGSPCTLAGNTGGRAAPALLQ